MRIEKNSTEVATMLKHVDGCLHGFEGC